MKRKRFIKNCVIVGAVMLLYLCVPQMLGSFAVSIKKYIINTYFKGELP